MLRSFCVRRRGARLCSLSFAIAVASIASADAQTVTVAFAAVNPPARHARIDHRGQSHVPKRRMYQRFTN